ncbi:MAG: DUF1902 domain-containing protein, partial [Gammaproteobacteria bacterium]
DDEAGVWCASSDDIRGLAIEAETKERLIERLEQVIPELWELNHAGNRKAARATLQATVPVASREAAPIELVTSSHQRLRLQLAW